jgi:hypothetical protein
MQFNYHFLLRNGIINYIDRVINGLIAVAAIIEPPPPPSLGLSGCGHLGPGLPQEELRRPAADHPELAECLFQCQLVCHVENGEASGHREG